MEFVSLILQILLSVVMLAMFVRSIMSFFPDLTTSKLYEILFAITEPFIMPARFVFEKLNYDDSFFLDVPYMVTYLVLMVVYWFLP